MRKKVLKVIVTFHTTSHAMAADSRKLAYHLSGRLIPVPRQLSAGCGLAWCEPVENKELLENMLAAEYIEYEELCVMEL